MGTYINCIISEDNSFTASPSLYYAECIIREEANEIIFNNITYLMKTNMVHLKNVSYSLSKFNIVEILNESSIKSYDADYAKNKYPEYFI